MAGGNVVGVVRGPITRSRVDAGSVLKRHRRTRGSGKTDDGITSLIPFSEEGRRWGDGK